VRRSAASRGALDRAVEQLLELLQAFLHDGAHAFLVDPWSRTTGLRARRPASVRNTPALPASRARHQLLGQGAFGRQSSPGT
jgi:hypothetical protein